MNNNSMIFVGIDLGDKFSWLAILDHEGVLIEETRLPTNQSSFLRKFSALAPCRVAMEVGAQSRWVSHLLQTLGHEVLVANARKLKAIYSNPRKDDRTDAETLARIARFDPHLLSPIHHRSPQAQADLAVIRSRDVVVRTRTALINHVRGSVKSTGARLPSCSADSFAAKVESSIPDPLHLALSPLLATISALTSRIKEFDHQIKRLCHEKYPVTSLLQQPAGIGPITALAFVLTLEDPDRFQKSRHVGPALGLVPKRDQSGDRDPQLSISKTGNGFLRRLLVNSAHYVLGPFGPDCDLRRWGLRLTERGGKNAKKRALVAVARKLSILLHHLWKSGEVYDPFYQSAKKQNQLTSSCAAT